MTKTSRISQVIVCLVLVTAVAHPAIVLVLLTKGTKTMVVHPINSMNSMGAMARILSPTIGSRMSYLTVRDDCFCSLFSIIYLLYPNLAL
jgi:hypothetical protein